MPIHARVQKDNGGGGFGKHAARLALIEPHLFDMHGPSGKPTGCRQVRAFIQTGQNTGRIGRQMKALLQFVENGFAARSVNTGKARQAGRAENNNLFDVALGIEKRVQFRRLQRRAPAARVKRNKDGIFKIFSLKRRPGLPCIVSAKRKSNSAGHLFMLRKSDIFHAGGRLRQSPEASRRVRPRESLRGCPTQ